MNDVLDIPEACLADARRVLATQDPETSRLADRWPCRTWRAAIKAVMAHINDQEKEAP